MKLHFEPNLDYQHARHRSGLRPVPRSGDLPHRVHRHARRAGRQARLAFAESDLGIGNRLTLLDDELLDEPQRHPAPQRPARRPTSLASGDFTVEMETGTGKTYVYLRTIFELNKRYGFTKFVIVVPSVAIKEGVYKTLQITEDHFRASTPARRSTTSSTTPPSSARCATSPPARRSRSWW